TSSTVLPRRSSGMWIFGSRSELSSTPGVTTPCPRGIEWYQFTFAISVWSCSVSTLSSPPDGNDDGGYDENESTCGPMSAQLLPGTNGAICPRRVTDFRWSVC